MRIFTINLKWNLDQDQDMVSTSESFWTGLHLALLLSWCYCSSTFTAGTFAWHCATWHAAILTWVLQAFITISPSHPFTRVTAPALLAYVVSKTGAGSFRVNLTVSTNAALPEVVSESCKTKGWSCTTSLIGFCWVEWGCFVACSNARCTCELLYCDLCVNV